MINFHPWNNIVLLRMSHLSLFHTNLSINLSIHLPIYHLSIIFFIERKKRGKERERNAQLSASVILQLLFAESFSVSSSFSEFGSAQRFFTKRASSFFIVVLVSWLLYTLLSVNKMLICMEILKSEGIVILDFHILYLP